MDGEKGMTAVEIIITLSLWTIILTLLLTILFLVVRGYGSNTDAMNAQYSARMVAFNLNKDIRSARQIELTDPEKIIIRGDDTSVSYYMEDGIVYRHSKAKTPIAEKVLDLHFSGQDNVIHYSLITGEADYAYNLEMTCSSRISLSGHI